MISEGKIISKHGLSNLYLYKKELINPDMGGSKCIFFQNVHIFEETLTRKLYTTSNGVSRVAI